MLEPGQVLQNRYEVQKQIGEGGMGTVYIAVDRRFGSTVAIKETLFADPGLRRAFEREAQLLNSLRHPALPRVSDHFTEENGAFIVMEYIAGEDLSAMVERDGAFALADVLRWADVLLDALDFLHTQKMPVIHRDIKPQNLKLTPRGEIILLDFGLAKGSASELTQASMTKSVFGYSRSYAPLEQIQGAGTDPRSDLYSLAATIYHLMTGKPPTDALSRATAVLNGNSDPLRPAHKINAKIPVSVSKVLLQAMALNANLRPASAAKMRTILADAANNPTTVEEDYDGDTILSSGDVYTQNTQLMNTVGATENAVNESAKTKGAANKTELQTTPSATLAEEVPAVLPHETAHARGFIGAPSSRRGSSSIKYTGIAAAILLLGGGGGFAAWYAANPQNASTVKQNTAQTVVTAAESKEPKTDANTVVNVPETKIVENVENTNVNTNVAVQTSPANAAEKSTSAPPDTPEQSKRETVKTEAGAKAKGETKIAVALPDTEVWLDEKAAAEMEKEIDTAIREAQKAEMGKTRADQIPPEIRSNDPYNPVDREKLKIYIKRKYEDALRRTHELNRKRAEQGLPPLKTPVPPKPRRMTRAGEQNQTPDAPKN